MPKMVLQLVDRFPRLNTSYLLFLLVTASLSKLGYCGNAKSTSLLPLDLFATYGVVTILEIAKWITWNDHLFQAVSGCAMPGTKRGKTLELLDIWAKGAIVGLERL